MKKGGREGGKEGRRKAKEVIEEGMEQREGGKEQKKREEETVGFIYLISFFYNISLIGVDGDVSVWFFIVAEALTAVVWSQFVK